jgi:CRISPR/Cas system-associated exonuclease Cas4 (RecB family)
MKTTQEIKDEYVKKVIAFSEAQEAKRKVDADGNAKDRSKDIYVTDIAAWDSYCSKKIYYDKVEKRAPPPEAVIRMTIGHVVHEIPLWDGEDDNGHEQAFTWNGIRCRMDEINFKEGIIVDKKTVASLPRSPKDYVIKQLNLYKIIAEENEERPTKINQLFVVNMGVINGYIEVLEVPIWTKEETKQFADKVMKEIRHHVENHIPPNVPYNSKGWLCDSCQYTDLCVKDSPCSFEPRSRVMNVGNNQTQILEVLEPKRAIGVSVKTGKK